MCSASEETQTGHECVLRVMYLLIDSGTGTSRGCGIEVSGKAGGRTVDEKGLRIGKKGEMEMKSPSTTFLFYELGI